MKPVNIEYLTLATQQPNYNINLCGKDPLFACDMALIKANQNMAIYGNNEPSYKLSWTTCKVYLCHWWNVATFFNKFLTTSLVT